MLYSNCLNIILYGATVSPTGMTKKCFHLKNLLHWSSFRSRKCFPSIPCYKSLYHKNTKTWNINSEVNVYICGKSCSRSSKTSFTVSRSLHNAVKRWTVTEPPPMKHVCRTIISYSFSFKDPVKSLKFNLTCRKRASLWWRGRDRWLRGCWSTWTEALHCRWYPW